MVEFLAAGEVTRGGVQLCMGNIPVQCSAKKGPTNQVNQPLPIILPSQSDRRKPLLRRASLEEHAIAKHANSIPRT